ncbi:MAG: hypothetical protein WC582_02360 [Patescibacteria group bacterium]|jgi:hypothetical protein
MRNLGDHPERQEGEIFIAMMESRVFSLIKFKTKRCGKLGSDDLVPVFISREEFEMENVLA